MSVCLSVCGFVSCDYKIILLCVLIPSGELTQEVQE